MKQLRCMKVFSLKSWQRTTKDRLAYFYKQIIAQIIAIIMPISASASITCKGHFVNPITDICWSCIMPISIGSPPTGIVIGKGAAPRKRDRETVNAT